MNDETRLICDINKKYRVMADPLNYILQKSSIREDSAHLKDKSKIGGTIWTNLGYYGNMGQLLKYLIVTELRGIDCETIEGYLKEYQKLSKEYINIISNLTKATYEK